MSILSKEYLKLKKNRIGPSDKKRIGVNIVIFKIYKKNILLVW